MQHNYTDSEAILYLYDELDSLSRQEFNLKLEEDIFLREEFNILAKTSDLLDLAFCKPNPTSIDIILDYSRSKSTEKAMS